jgi:hypothetical protein
MKEMWCMIFYGLLLAGCNNIFRDTDKIKSSLPGTYINQSAGSYSIAFDTLVINTENENIFSVERRVSFIKIRHGIQQSREYHLEHWLAVYDDKTKVLTETKRGRILSYVPEKKKLYLNNSVYQKIN